jgi:putative transposase
MSRGERKALIRRDQPELSLSRQCEILAISRSSFYYTPKGESPANLALMRRIDELFLKYPFYGSRQMVRQLRRDGVRVGRHRVRRLMRPMGLEAIYQAPRTSDPHPSHRVYPYLLKGLVIDRPNQVWCADITYIPVSRGFLYLVAIMDWATRHVLAWRLSNTMDASFCVAALNEALARCGRPEIFNTDQDRSGPIRTDQDRSGQPVHQLRVHRRAQGRGCRDLHGRKGPMHGQHLHRAAVAVAQIRSGPPA